MNPTYSAEICGAWVGGGGVGSKYWSAYTNLKPKDQHYFAYKSSWSYGYKSSSQPAAACRTLPLFSLSSLVSASTEGFLFPTPTTATQG